MSDIDDKQPESASNIDNSEPLILRVRCKPGGDTFFKVKKHTELYKVFDAFANVKHIERSDLLFFLNGEPIGPNQTPEQLGLEDNDQIHCCFRGAVPISVRVRYTMSREEIWYKMKNSTKMHVLFDKCAEHMGRKYPGCGRGDIRLLLDGEHVSWDHTPQKLGMTHEDMLDCMAWIDNGFH